MTKFADSVLREKVFEYVFPVNKDIVVVRGGYENSNVSDFIREIHAKGWSIAQRDVLALSLPDGVTIRYVYHCVKWEDAVDKG